MWKVREDEPQYAFLKDPQNKAVNYYEAPIDLIARSGGVAPAEREMFINDEPGVGANPNRNKQHAFHFTADNCIGCHACEAACSEKNDNPPHISFRSVGYVEGGTYPDFTRMNISMACNHCDDPVCLKGCPTRAYTKHAEYGAVLQDPETCFGCGYCTWVCPYNAPQLDPVKGQVSKCNMCVDRLEVGLKPACVSACLGNALNFGVVENTPDNREQTKLAIPGFPDPEITHPNIRFQQKKKLPDTVTRTDGMPVKYHRQDDGSYRPAVDQKKGKAKHWNLTRLSSRENPLVAFTLLTQTSLGAFFIMFFGGLLKIPGIMAVRESLLYVPLMAICAGCCALGLFMSTIHLGKPLRAYRGFNNLRHSPVCREGLGIFLYLVFVGLHMLSVLPENALFTQLTGLTVSFGMLPDLLSTLAIPAGAGGLYYMYRCYRIPARPFWNHWQTATHFVGNAIVLGALLVMATALAAAFIAPVNVQGLVPVIAALLVVGLIVEGLGLWRHAQDMNKLANEGAASHYIQCTTFGKSYVLRNVLIVSNLAVAAALFVVADISVMSLSLLAFLTFSVGCSALIGRALFYVLVVPTTMPGAFFWKNKDFEQHARDIGLAHFPQVGVVPDAH
ncbi:Anaerobic dimethyl sulfoxide reductase chain B [Thalassocella blandensis]|nr:Anaerobic dimethyl sulfoxide reductase chain B [Thalassocella blandensis]